ncbi:MAG: aldo/keto reductase [Armatimonadota bacterium]
MALSITSTVALNNGVRMQVLGLGTWQLARGETVRRAVRVALDAGYRLIDTAAAYGNEADIGAAIVESGIDRSELFITTKLWITDMTYPRTLAACRRSLQRLRLDYLDLYLIHWPVPWLWPQAWRALMALQEEGLCRAIGVSNFEVRHLQHAMQLGSVPVVNQVEFSPFLYRRELLQFCRDHGIQLESYSPLTRGAKLRDPRVTALAQHYGKTSAQLFLRWALQHGVVTIPKSTHPERIRENADLFDFEITPGDMAVLDTLNEEYYTVPAIWRRLFR